MLRILCVDDDGLVLSVTADLLRALDHDVIEAVGGEQAATVLDGDSAFDLLVTDIYMPGGPDGPDLAMLARRHNQDLPVIFFSGSNQMIPSLGDDPILRKPCTLGELQQAIEIVAPTPPRVATA